MKNKVIKQGAIFNGKYFDTFGIKPHTASIYGYKPEDIVSVELTISDNQELPDPAQRDSDEGGEPDYWAWWENKRQDFVMVYASRFKMELYFPDGIAETEKLREGKSYRVNVIEVKK